MVLISDTKSRLVLARPAINSWAESNFSSEADRFLCAAAVISWARTTSLASLAWRPAAAARPAGAQECDPYPKVAWWGALSHESVTKYVRNRHNGEWNAYIQKWQNQGNRLK